MTLNPLNPQKYRCKPPFRAPPQKWGRFGPEGFCEAKSEAPAGAGDPLAELFLKSENVQKFHCLIKEVYCKMSLVDLQVDKAHFTINFLN